MAKFLKINVADNVAVAIEPLKAGEYVNVEGVEFALKNDIPAGHKFLLTDLKEGENVIKYGYPIGHLREDHKQGEFINDVNIKTNLAGLLDYSYSPVFTAEDVATMADAKVTLALPRCDVDPVGTEGLETLTQRFWEGMLSRSVLVGRAPKELIELIGYNPVIDLDRNNAETQIKNIIDNIEKYQTLVDRNRETALKMAPWDIRIKKIMSWLTDLGYKI